MHEIFWEFLPKRGRTAEFVAAYGAEGPWAALFRRGSGYLGTELQPVVERPGWYRTVDRWTSEQDYLMFRERFAAEYVELDRACEPLTAEERLAPPSA
ncbi:MAG: hypothetical protein ABI647_00955 [Gemmatimonadota bacterium]